MALSSKRIIEIIRSIDDEYFDEHTVISAFQSRSKKEFGKKPKKDAKDFRSIHETLNGLIDTGVLNRSKKGLSVSRLDFTGIIRITKAGGEIDLGAETVIIKPEDSATASEGDSVSVSITEVKKNALFGKVSKVLSKARDTFFAVVQSKTKGLIFIRLIDIPGEYDVVAERYEGEPEIGDYVSIRVGTQSISGRPRCEILEKFESGSPALDTDRIILRHNLPGKHKDYPEFTDIYKSVPASELKNRRDFRNLLTVTIDGEHAKDFDDAVSFEGDDKGYTLYVHIADVSAYIRKGSELDREAAKRGTSYYLGDRVVPMLPEVLSNNLCSLRPHEDRLTLSAVMRYDLKGKLVSSDFTRGIIYSAHRLTYENAHTLITSPDGSVLSEMLRGLHDFTVLLKKTRIARGRVDLQMNDFEMVFENGQFVEFKLSPRFTSHFLVEESMLSANEAVARVLREKDIPAMYRVHEPTSLEQIGALKKFLNLMGVTFKPGKNLGVSLQNIVEEVREKEYSHVINYVILRSMMQAFYGEKPLGHFGLGFTDYTHFTSPIRRYPDLIVHRCLKSYIDGADFPYTKDELAAIGLESSRLERVAQKAERDLVKLKSCRIMKDHVGETFPAVISGVTKFGIYAAIADSPIEGMVPLRTLTDDYYLLLEDQFSVRGRKFGKTFRLGDRINVRVTRADVLLLQIDFEIVTGRSGAKKKTDERKRKESGGKSSKSRHRSSKKSKYY
jgi:ribonuclease R